MACHASLQRLLAMGAFDGENYVDGMEDADDESDVPDALDPSMPRTDRLSDNVAVHNKDTFGLNHVPRDAYTAHAYDRPLPACLLRAEHEPSAYPSSASDAAELVRAIDVECTAYHGILRSATEPCPQSWMARARLYSSMSKLLIATMGLCVGCSGDRVGSAEPVAPRTAQQRQWIALITKNKTLASSTGALARATWHHAQAVFEPRMPKHARTALVYLIAMHRIVFHELRAARGANRKIATRMTHLYYDTPVSVLWDFLRPPDSPQPDSVYDVYCAEYLCADREWVCETVTDSGTGIKIRDLPAWSPAEIPGALSKGESAPEPRDGAVDRESGPGLPRVFDTPLPLRGARCGVSISELSSGELRRLLLYVHLKQAAVTWTARAEAGIGLLWHHFCRMLVLSDMASVAALMRPSLHGNDSCVSRKQSPPTFIRSVLHELDTVFMYHLEVIRARWDAIEHAQMCSAGKCMPHEYLADQPGVFDAVDMQAHLPREYHGEIARARGRGPPLDALFTRLVSIPWQGSSGDVLQRSIRVELRDVAFAMLLLPHEYELFVLADSDTMDLPRMVVVLSRTSGQLNAISGVTYLSAAPLLAAAACLRQRDSAFVKAALPEFVHAASEYWHVGEILGPAAVRLFLARSIQAGEDRLPSSSSSAVAQPVASSLSGAGGDCYLDDDDDDDDGTPVRGSLADARAMPRLSDTAVLSAGNIQTWFHIRADGYRRRFSGEATVRDGAEFPQLLCLRGEVWVVHKPWFFYRSRELGRALYVFMLRVCAAFGQDASRRAPPDWHAALEDDPIYRHYTTRLAR